MDGTFEQVRTASRAKPRGSAVFPLPLAPYERYMLADDTADYPMAFVIAIVLSGDLRRPAFEQALQEAVRLHPLLSSRAVWIVGSGWCWVPIPDFMPPVDWNFGDAAVQETAPRIDLMQEAGLRVEVVPEGAQVRVAFQFHHAATDGIGAIQFIGDLLGVYGQLTAAPGQEVPEVATPDPGLLPDRARLWPAGDAPQRGFLARLAGHVLDLLRKVPEPVAVPPGAVSHAPSGSGRIPFVSRSFPRSVHTSLKEQAARQAVTVNDLLMLEMFHTIRDWNRRCGRNESRSWYRIGVPVNLRTPLDDDQPAANVLSYMFLTRRARDCDREEELLESIHRETESVIRGDARRMFMVAVKRMLQVPGLLNVLLRAPVCQATAILANVGEVRRHFRTRFPLKQGKCVAGNVVLTALLGAAPIRRRTRVAVSLGTYAGVLLVNMQCDPRCFTPIEAEQLADLFAGRIQQRAARRSLLKVAS